MIVAFIISFSFLFVFLYSFPDSVQFRERKFYSQNFDPNATKIFLLGSSHVGELNATFINLYLSSHYQNYIVYNLAYYADTPSERLKTLKDIILLKPKMVVYGISYRDISSSTNNKILPDPRDLFSQTILGSNVEDNFNIPNPKITTETMIHYLSKRHDFTHPLDAVYMNYTPFFPYLPSDGKIATYDELKSESETSDAPGVYIDPSFKSQDILALNEIVKELHKNNIKIVIFTTPHSKIYIDGLPPHQQELFKSLLEELKNSGVPVYDLTDRYENSLIFKDINHVAYNSNSSIYSQDILKIILTETES